MELELQEFDSNRNESIGGRINVSSDPINSDSNSSSSSTSSQPLDESSTKDDLPFLNYDSPSAAHSPSSPVNIQELEKKFAAYVRKDVYGVMGRGELPLREKFLVGISLVTLVPLRLVVAFLILLLYYMICRLCTLLLTPHRDDEQEDYAHMGGWRRAAIFHCGRFLSRAMLFTVGFYWIKQTIGNHSNAVGKSTSTDIGQTEHESQGEELERAGVIISNHVSYLDILYHMSSSFPSFVAKRSVAKIPLVGLISKCLGCVYVQRESKSSDFKGVSGVVTERIEEAHQNKYAPMMMLFPEGTTTNGEFLLPFKTGAFLSKTPVLPLILKYPYQRFSPAWDSISGVRHVILLLCQFVNHMEVMELPLYRPSQQEKENSVLYATNVRSLMAREGNLTQSDVGLAEKRVYHTALNGNNSLLLMPTTPTSVLHPKDD